MPLDAPDAPGVLVPPGVPVPLLGLVAQQRKYISSTAFKKKFKMYCSWKGYVLNPHKYDSVTGLPFQVDKDGRPIVDDKSGGVEYFTLGINKDLVQPSTESSEHLIDF